MPYIEQIIHAVTIIVATVIGALISYRVASWQFSAKNRQDWINKLRELLAEYKSLLFTLHADFRLAGRVRSGPLVVVDFMKANLIRNQVELMINP